MEQEPNWSDPHLLMARTHARLGEREKALEALSIASDFDPTDPSALMLQGMLSELQGEKTASTAFYRRALELYDGVPEDADDGVALAVTTYLAKGRPAGLGVIREVAARHPDYRRAAIIEEQIAAGERDFFLNEVRPDATLDQGE